MRFTLWTLSGFLSGLLIGILSPFAALAYVAWYDGTKWPTLGLAEILVFSVAGLEGAVNGAIGTMDGLRSRLRRLWPIAAVPALLPIVPLLVFQGDDENHRTIDGSRLQLMVCVSPGKTFQDYFRAAMTRPTPQGEAAILGSS
jgi:hypothetical protein